MKTSVKGAMGIASKITLYTGLVTLLALSGTLFLLFRVQTNAARDEEAHKARLQQVESARLLQVNFKKQVQEWKDILLRGHEPADLDKYKTAFFREEAGVQANAQTLMNQVNQANSRAMFVKFLEMHKILGEHYRAALNAFVANGKFDYKQADRMVRGEDRPLTDSIDEVVRSINADFDAYEISHTAAIQAEEHYMIIGTMLLFSGLMLGGIHIARQITAPILELSQVISKVSSEQDYTLRAKRRSGDEVGLLADGFNDMLARIQSQSAARRLADEALEASRQKLEDIIHSVDGIVWEADALTLKFTFVSHRAEQILGYPLEQWLTEPDFWRKHLHAEDLSWASDFCAKAVSELRGHEFEYRMIAADGREVWVNDIVTVIGENGRPTKLRGIIVDITESKLAAKQLAQTHQQLLETSRQAGMAEVATSVLHNVGNVLNSVSVSAEVVAAKVRQFRVGGLKNVAALLREKGQDLPDFLAHDPRGRELPDYMVKLADSLAEPQRGILDELESLKRNIEHIKEVVATQQNYGRRSGMLATLSLVDVVEDAIRINSAGLVRHEVQLSRDFGEVPPFVTDRHKLLQILVNLLSNAKYAMDEAGPDKRVTVGVRMKTPETAEIVVSDNGVGIASENLTRIFQHGFTTKKDGHGFGLHSGALAARELGGKLIAQSDGLGHGAVFTLELPLQHTPRSDELPHRLL